MKFEIRWDRCFWDGYVKGGKNLTPHTLYVVASVAGRSPTRITNVSVRPLADENWWEIVAGELVPLKFFGTERMAKRRALHLALQLLNGALNAVADELAKEEVTG